MVGTYDEDGWSHNLFVLSVAAIIYCVMLLIALAVETVLAATDSEELHDARLIVLSLLDLPLFQAVRHFNDIHYDAATARIFPSLLVCMLYVINTYLGHVSTLSYWFFAPFGVSMLLFLLFQIPCEPRPWRFVLRYECALDVISLVSLFLSRGEYFLNFSFLQVYIVLSRFQEVLPILAALFWKKPEPHLLQMIKFTAIFFAHIFVFASGLQLFERLGDPLAVFRTTSLELTMWNALYFTFVTVFTVGYGDFIPFTLLGRTWMVFVVFVGVLLVSYKISKFHELSQDYWEGNGAFVKQEGIKHVVLCGNVKWSYLKAFIEEFYSDGSQRDIEIVVMQRKSEWPDKETSKKFFTKYKKQVHIFNGTCMHEEDLGRARVKNAEAVFVLSNQHNPNIYAEDSETLKRILTIRSYAPEIPIFAMCALTDSMFQIAYALENPGVDDDVDEHKMMHEFDNAASIDDDSDGMVNNAYEEPKDPQSEAICMQDLEMSMLAANVFCNGLSTLLSNLLLNNVPTKDPADDEEPWLKEYKAGTENCFHFVKIPGDLDGTIYRDIALMLYDHGVVLLATKTFFSKAWIPIQPDTPLSHSSIGLVVTFLAAIDLKDVITKTARRHIDETSTRESSFDRAASVVDRDDFAHRTPSWHEIAGAHLTGDGHILHFDDYDDQGGFDSENFDDDEALDSAASGVDDDPFFNTPGQHASQSPYNVPEPAFDLPPPVVAAGFNVSAAADDLQQHASDDDVLDGVDNPEEFPGDSGFITTPRPRSPVAAPLEQPITVDDEADRELDAEIVQRDHSPPPQPQPPRWLATSSPGRSVLRRTRSHSHSNQGTATSAGGTTRVAFQGILDSGAALARSPSQTQRNETRTPEGRSKSVSDLPILPRVEPRQDTESNDAPHSLSCLPELQPSHQTQTQPPPQVLEILPDVSATLAEYHRNVHRERDNAAAAAPGAAAVPGPSSVQEAQHSPGFTRLRFSEDKEHGNRVVFPGQASASGDSTGNLHFERRIHVSYGDAPLPVQYRKHIVVCVIGAMGMMNLRQFLIRLRAANRARESVLQVVAICPVVGEEAVAELEEVAGCDVSLVQGNSLSISTLKAAQYESASTVILLACEDKKVTRAIDSRTIYTIMSLDHLIQDNANVFVCSMIDSEESLHLLRAPHRIRLRIGELGETALQRRKSFRSLRALGTFRSQYSMRSIAAEPLLSRGFSVYDLPRTLSMAGSAASHRVDRGLRQSRSFHVSKARDAERELRVACVRERLEDESLARMQSFNGAPFLTRVSTASKRAWLLGSPAALSGAAPRVTQRAPRKSRDDAFEKERYASGELMISSMFIALLIREMNLPGLTKVVAALFGTRLETQPCWVRSIPVPRSWMPKDKNDKPLEYRDLCAKLLEHACVPLGLYRCGTAPIRVFSPPDEEVESSLFQFGRSASDGAQSYRSMSARDSPPATPRIPSLEPPMYPDAFADVVEEYVQERRVPGTDDGEENSPPNHHHQFRLDEGELFGTYHFVTSDRKVGYRVYSNGFNALPYVYTNPEPYTVVSRDDAIFVLVHPKINLKHLK